MTPWLLTLLPACALGTTLVNLASWPRPRPPAPAAPGLAGLPPVSVLLPARNEEATIAAAVASALAEPVHEVVVYDDGSTDRTPDKLAAFTDPRLRVIRGVALPDGWVGKPHACHRLAEAAEGELLLFMDADVQLKPGAVRALVAERRRWGAAVLTAVPEQTVGGLAEQLVVPLLHLTYTSWLPNVAVPLLPFTSMVAANGQLLAISRSAYDAIGGFASVHDAVVDDMALCRRAKRLGHRVVFADGHLLARCRMYGSPTEVWEGFSKNIYTGVGGPLGMVVVLGLYFATFLLPWLALPASVAAPALLGPAVAAVAANVLQRALLALRHDHPVSTVVLHPAGIAALLAIAINSWRWSAAGTIRWAGRTYPGSHHAP